MSNYKYPRCPYCTTKMLPSVFECNGEYYGHFRCKCGAYTPFINSAASRHECIKAAIAAASEASRPQKPIAIEDIAETLLVTPCWIELQGRIPDVLEADILDRDSADIFRRSDRRYLPRRLYGKTWRAWATYPTEEERRAAEWEAVADD